MLGYISLSIITFFGGAMLWALGDQLLQDVRIRRATGPTIGFDGVTLGLSAVALCFVVVGVNFAKNDSDYLLLLFTTLVIGLWIFSRKPA
jgi:hypothetical protein